jgi:hypothetical protein
MTRVNNVSVKLNQPLCALHVLACTPMTEIDDLLDGTTYALINEEGDGLLLIDKDDEDDVVDVELGDYLVRIGGHIEVYTDEAFHNTFDV